MEGNFWVQESTLGARNCTKKRYFRENLIAHYIPPPKDMTLATPLLRTWFGGRLWPNNEEGIVCQCSDALQPGKWESNYESLAQDCDLPDIKAWLGP